MRLFNLDGQVPSDAHAVVNTPDLTRRQTLLVAGLALAAPGLALAQSWPSKPIRLVVPFPPGGLIDIMARLVAPKLAQELGQPVVIDNKPGAGGNLGAAEVARAPADGYTLLMASPPLTISPALYASMPYKPEQIAPIGLVGRVPNVLLVNPKSGINSVADLIARAKREPARMNYASNGNGTSLHLSAELLKSSTGTFITHIPYRGAGPALNDTVAGQVQIHVANANGQTVTFVVAGKKYVRNINSDDFTFTVSAAKGAKSVKASAVLASRSIGAATLSLK
jgi:tripartite-type tricarboxylate transporter receptor subunit TctC